MTGRQEVARLEQRLDSVFTRVKMLGGDAELQSDFARYLCILVSGYLETSAKELVLEYSRKSGNASVQRFVDQRTKQFTNAKTEKLKSLLNDFNPDWRSSLEAYAVDDLKDAVDSIVTLRNRIAHGQSVGLTYQTVSNYYNRVKLVVSHIASLCDPV